MKLCRATSLYLFTAAVALAQSAGGLAAISGVVRDPSGSVVPNAKVVISNETIGANRNLITNEAGVFTAPALTPASGYRVVVSAAGFSGYEAKDVVLQVGQGLDLDVRLTVSQASASVEVTAAAPLVEDSKTSVSQVIDSQQIVELPINGRRVDSFVLLTPGVTNDGTFGLLSFRGVAGHNAFLIDGNDTTEQFYNENAGRTRIASQISQDAVDQFEVVSTNMSAAYGRAMGGVVNTVTKSGTNKTHGTAYWFFRNQDFNARDRYASFNPDESRHQAGASVGGTIVKDKLFYFANVDFTRRDFPMVNSLNTSGVVDPISKTFVGCAAPATATQCAAINTLLPRFYGQIPRTASNDLYFGKLDYRVTERNTLSASLNYMRFVSPNGIQTGATSTSGSGINSNGDDRVRVRNGRFSWTAVPKSNFVNEFRFGWATDIQADTFDDASLGQGLGYLQVSVAGATMGPANYLPRIEPNEQRFQYADNVTWTKGKHLIKFGADIASSADYTYFISNAYGNYSYQTVTKFALDYSGNTTGAKNWNTYSQTFGNPVVDATINDFGFYLEDQWRVTPRLTANIGARYEYAQLPQPKLTNPDYKQTANIPSDPVNLAPRIGLAYKINDKTVIRAGYGMFHARFIGSLIDNLFTNNAVLQNSLSLSSTNATQLAAGPVFPNALAAQPANGTLGASNIQFMQPGTRTPYSEQGNLAIERQFGRDWAATVSYIWSRGVLIGGVRDLNIPSISSTNFTYTIADASGNPVGSYTTPIYLGSARPDPRYGTIAQYENGVNSYYNALALYVRKRFSHGLQASASWTWAHAIDDGQGNGSGALFFSSASNWTYNGNWKADKGDASLDHRHRVVYNFVWQPTPIRNGSAALKGLLNHWQLSAISTMGSGRPVNATIRLTDTPVPGMWRTTNLSGSGLSNRVPFWPVGSLHTPPSYRADARLSKLVPLRERMRLEFSFDVFNVSNTISDTSITNQAYTEAKGVLTLTPASFGVGTADGGYPDGTQARRMQIGLRLTF